MIDALIYGALTNNNLATFLGVAPNIRVYPAKSLGHNGIPAKPDYPYVQYGDGGTTANDQVRETRKSYSSLYEVYVYDDPGSFQRIKKIHDIIQDNLLSIVGSTHDRWTITDLRFQSFSSDGYDPINQQNSKRATYRLVVSTARQ